MKIEQFNINSAGLVNGWKKKNPKQIHNHSYVQVIAYSY